MRNNGHRRVRSQANYWWVCAVEKTTGRPLVHGTHNTDTDARQWGFEHIKDGDFEVFAFPTVNRISARDYFKSIILERTNTLSSVFKRAKYPI